nr:putative F-box/LRR-repeat protein 23 isoform X3 [Ipomoea trifida]
MKVLAKLLMSFQCWRSYKLNTPPFLNKELKLLDGLALSSTHFPLSREVTSQYNGSCDEEAVAIAENMHGLKHLTLVGNDMSDKGVEAILDGCPSLQSLYIADCICVRLEGELGKRCSQQIKDLNHIPQPRTRFFF